MGLNNTGAILNAAPNIFVQATKSNVYYAAICTVIIYAANVNVYLHC